MATDVEKNAQSAVDTNTPKHDTNNGAPFIETLEHAAPGYANDRSSEVAKEIADDEENNPHIHHHVRPHSNKRSREITYSLLSQQMSWSLFWSLTAMSFLWVGSQIPLYMIGSVIPLIYNDIGGYYIYIWLIIGYLIPNAALCPFVGAFSDLVGRKPVAAVGQVLLIIGPVVTVTAKSMRPAIGESCLQRRTVMRMMLTDA